MVTFSSSTTSDLKLGVFQSLDKAKMLEELLGWENKMVNKTNNNTKARNSNNETTAAKRRPPQSYLQKPFLFLSLQVLK